MAIQFSNDSTLVFFPFKWLSTQTAAPGVVIQMFDLVSFSGGRNSC